ncbi:hypothetical protein F5148DRAFT_59582 [Russula earlei]|uniref:Uncharacterized protein n=1 Tax=Russula earlei TaxID=71964 RepID=A0ACC0UMB8_9AGAM|nr:hypothetical protein F5148DRAFT_59582 [Russula earlei]
MDRFVVSQNPAYKKNHGKNSVDNKYEPYDPSSTGSSNGGSVSKACTQRTLTRHLLNTLTDESNPITHSDIGIRSDHVVSITKGHQRSDGRGQRQGYVRMRNQKLKQQRETVVLGVLNNTRVYVNGYLRDTTDIEMKRIITEAGGQALQSASNATHIITSEHLSGAKAHKMFTTSQVYIVRPEWVTDSIAAGRRLREEKYMLDVHVTRRAEAEGRRPDLHTRQRQ